MHFKKLKSTCYRLITRDLYNNYFEDEKLVHFYIFFIKYFILSNFSINKLIFLKFRQLCNMSL